MRVWLPSVRAKSGGDVYVERLAALLKHAGHEAIVSWFSHAFELAPSLLEMVKVPANVEVIHANSWNAFAFTSHGIPVVATVHHCVRGVGYPEWKTWAQMLYHEQWISRLEERSFQSCSSVIAVSASTEHDVVKYFGVHAKVINNWVDTELFQPSALREVGSPRVLFVGNLSRRKGGDLLPVLRERLGKDIELHVVAGRRASDSVHLPLGSNTKIWAGLSTEQLIHLYQQCDIVVCLSRHEGFGYAALEAMACGRPVIAFDVAGIRDVVDAEVTGVLCPCEDIEGIAEACHRLIGDRNRAARMGMAGRLRAVEFFSMTRAIVQYKELYQELLVGN
jgi:glycosyltransferase involved in cell wall biosynthesis